MELNLGTMAGLDTPPTFQSPFGELDCRMENSYDLEQLISEMIHSETANSCIVGDGELCTNENLKGPITSIDDSPIVSPFEEQIMLPFEDPESIDLTNTETGMFHSSLSEKIMENKEVETLPIKKELTQNNDVETLPINTVELSTTDVGVNSIEGVGFIVDPAMANLPPELKNVDKIILVCPKSEIPVGNITSANNLLKVAQQEQSLAQVPIITEGRSANIAQPFIQIPVLKQETIANDITEHPEADIHKYLSVEFSEPTGNVLQYENTIKPPASQAGVKKLPSTKKQCMPTTTVTSETLSSVNDIMKILHTQPSYKAGLHTEVSIDLNSVNKDEASREQSSQWTRPTLNLSHTTATQNTDIGLPLSTLNTPEASSILNDQDAPFDLLQYVLQQSNENDALTIEGAEFKPISVQHKKRKAQPLTPPRTKKSRKAVSVKMETSLVELQPSSSRTHVRRKSEITEEKYLENRRKNNIASARSRQTRKLKKQENENLLSELISKNEELKRKEKNMESLVASLKEMLFKVIAINKS